MSGAGTALGIAGLITSILGAGTSAGMNIGKARKQDRYAEELEKAQEEERKRQEEQRRREAIANYLGVGREQSLIEPGRTSMPKSPYLMGYDIGSGLGTLGAQYGPKIFDAISRYTGGGISKGVGGGIGTAGG